MSGACLRILASQLFRVLNVFHTQLQQPNIQWRVQGTSMTVWLTVQSKVCILADFSIPYNILGNKDGYIFSTHKYSGIINIRISKTKILIHKIRASNIWAYGQMKFSLGFSLAFYLSLGHSYSWYFTQQKQVTWHQLCHGWPPPVWCSIASISSPSSISSSSGVCSPRRRRPSNKKAMELNSTDCLSQ